MQISKNFDGGEAIQARFFSAKCAHISKAVVYISCSCLFVFLALDGQADDSYRRFSGRINFPVWFEYNGIYCGQLGATWVPGTIGRRKRFTPYYLQLRYLERKIRKTTDARTRKSLLARRTRIQDLMRQHTIACSVASQQRINN